MEKDRRQRLANQKRLRQLVRTHGEKVKVFCSHDIVELGAMKKRSRSLDSIFRRRPDLSVLALTSRLAGGAQALRARLEAGDAFIRPRSTS
jgi:hypothetical protein